MNAICSHQWIDPNDPLVSRGSCAPVIGPGRREMKAGTTYRCQRCGAMLTPRPHRVHGVIAEVCSVCAYTIESAQHINHCRS